MTESISRKFSKLGPHVSATGTITTNAATASAWETARTLTLSGDVSGNVSIDGSENVTLTATVSGNSVALGTDTTGDYVASITNGNYITGGNGGSEGATLTLAVDATSDNTASKVVARDASGNFSAGTITATLSGNASTATTWATGRTIALTGDVTGTSGAFDGSGNLSFATTLANSGVTAGTFTKVTVDAKGRVTTGASLASGDLPTYTGTLTSSQVTTALGYTPYNATNPNGYTTNTGTVTSVSGTGTASGLTLSGTVTTSGNLTLSGTVNSLAAGTYAISISGNAATATSATTAGALTSMNISQFTNNSGYITGLSFDGLSSKTGGTGTYTTSGDFRAPIFYDSNDTTFYVNPNGKSELSSLALGYTSGTVYNTAGQGTLFFNNHGESDIQGYSIGTTMEDYGGNYTKLTIDWHTGIKIGAYTSYGGIRFYSNSVKYYGGSKLFSIGEGDGHVRATNVLFGGESVRSPIFYDSNNTGYYVDPASTSVFNGAYFSTIYNNTLGSGFYFTNGDWGWRHQTPSGWIQFGPANTSYAHIYTDRGNFYLNVNDLYLNGNLVPAYGYNRAGSMYASVYYDSNDTTYYIDPNSTGTSLNMAGSVRQANYNKPGLMTVASGTASTGGSLAIQQETGEGWTGIFVDFEPYTGWGLWHDNPNNYFSFTAEASTGQIRSFTVPSRVSGNRTAYEKFRIDQNNGDTITGRIAYANESSRSPIFYDNNNTGYYTDPASTSNLNALQTYSYQGNGNVGGTGSAAWFPSGLYVASGLPAWLYGPIYRNGQNTFGGGTADYTIVYDTNDSNYYVDPNGTSRMNRVDPNEIYNHGWFRNLGDSGWYSQAYGYGAWWAQSGGNSYGNATTYGTGRNGWSGWGIGSRHVFMSTTGDNVGVHDNSRGWIWYWDGSYTRFDYGYTQFAGSARAPIFYDSNDTNWYCDPNGGSRFWTLSLENRLYIYGGNPGDPGSDTTPQVFFKTGGGMGLSSIEIDFWTGFTGSSYPNNFQIGFRMAYDKRLYVWQDLVQYYSDERLKEKTGTLAGALDAIKAWTPFKYVDNALANSFNFGSGRTQIGLSAQEVQQYYPELVELAPFDVQNDFSDETNPRRVSKSGENYLTLNYTRLVPVLIQAIKEQQAKIEELERRINNS